MILKCASFPIQNDPESWDLPRCQVDADSHGKRRSAEAGKNRGFSGRQCRDRFHRTDAHGTICVDSEGIGGATSSDLIRMEDVEALRPERIEDFLGGSAGIDFTGQTRTERYAWIQRALVEQLLPI